MWLIMREFGIGICFIIISRRLILDLLLITQKNKTTECGKIANLIIITFLLIIETDKYVV